MPVFEEMVHEDPRKGQSKFSSDTPTVIGIRATYHFADTKSVEDTSSIKMNIMDSSTLSGVESDSEPPVLPLDKATVNGEGWPFGLQHIERLESLSCSILQ